MLPTQPFDVKLIMLPIVSHIIASVTKKISRQKNFQLITYSKRLLAVGSLKGKGRKWYLFFSVPHRKEGRHHRLVPRRAQQAHS